MPGALSATALAVCLLLQRSPAQAQANALPTGGTVAAGRVDIGTPAGNALTITQQSSRAVVNWSSFNIGAGQSVNVVQPNAQAAILNRVTGSTTSTLAGQLNANGQVFLVNPNGIAITATGSTNTGSFVASTLDIADHDFLAGRLAFMGAGSSAAVANAGSINSAPGGFAALLGGRVANSGIINVPAGKVGLGAGERITLDLSGDGFLQVAMPSQGVNGGPLVQHSGVIQADGGMVQIEVAAAREAARQAVNLSGVVQARTVSGHSGAIVLGGGEGAVQISGRLDTSSAAAQGGNITVTGRDITLQGAALDASGGAGGGSIRIGGERQGGGALQRAEATTLDAATTLHADATRTGDGGQVVVWADGDTAFAGRISARGAGAAGNGGEAEVSGRTWLAYTGSTDLRAAANTRTGRTGNLLLDPYNVTISTGADTGAGFTAGANNTVINTTTLQNALGTANVTVSTGGGGAQSGDITVSNSVSWSSGNQLTLNAANNIAVNAPLSATGGGGIQLTAGNQVTLASTLSVGSGAGLGVSVQANDSIIGNSGASITTQGQAITLNSDRDASGAGAITLTGTTMTSNGGDVTLSGGAGSVSTLQTSGFARGTSVYAQRLGIYLGSSSINSGAGSVWLRGVGSNSASQDDNGVDIRTNSSITTTTGAVNVVGTAGGDGTNGGTHGVILYSNASIASSSGNITLTGTGGSTTPDIQSGIWLSTGVTLGTGGAGALTLNATAPNVANGANTAALVLKGAVAIQSNGSGAITINTVQNSTPRALWAYGFSGTNIKLGLGNLSGSYTGALTINADSIDLSTTGSTATIAGSGTLTIQPVTAGGSIALGASATGTLNLDATELGFLANGFSGITIGSATGSGAVDVRAVTFADPVTIRSPTGSGSITLNGALATGSGSSAGSITLQAGNGITMASGSSLTTPGQAVVMAGDADASGAGSVSMSSSTITTNGGNLMASGAQSGTGTAVNLSGATVNVGTGTGSLGGTSTNGFGILISGSTSLVASGGGSLTLTGSTPAGTVTNAAGVGLAASAALSTTGTVTLTGSGGTTGSSSALGRGIALDSNASITSAGNLTLQGTALATSSNSDGIYFVSNNTLTASSGTLTATANAAANAQGINQNSGTLTLNNAGGGSFSLAGTSVSSAGLRVGTNAALSTSGNVSVSGTSTTDVGVLVNGGSAMTATSGNLTLSGTSTSDAGIQFRGTGTITNSGAGQIAFTGTTSSYRGIEFFSGMGLTVAGNVSMTGNANTGAAVQFSGSNSMTLSSGNLIIGGTSTSGTGALFNGTDSLTNAGAGSFTVSGSSGSGTGLRLSTAAALTTTGNLGLTGSSTSATGIVLSATGTLNNSGSGQLTVAGSGGAASTDLGATVSSSAGKLSLSGTGSVNQSAGSITAASLELLGTGGQFVLSATGNAVTTLAGNTGSVQLVNSTALGVGTANSVGLTTTGAVTLQTTGATADVTLAQAINASAGGDAVVIASGRNFVNNAGASGIGLSGGGRFLVYSADWAADTAGGLSAGHLYNRSYGGNPPGTITQTGSQFIHSRQPLLMVAAQDATRVYGAADPALSASITGLVNGDSAASAYSGSAALATAATATSAVGSYAITPSAGTLASSLGYGLTYAPGSLSVTARPITVTADAQGRVYGNANPTLTYSVGGSGLVNGDTLSGALTTSATTSSNVGSYGITQGSLAAASNYTLSYSGSNLSVTPRAITVTADAQSRVYGDANPALTYAIGGPGLVNGDTLAGGPTTAANTSSNVGSYAIAQGNLAASSNYTLSYTGANLAVTARAITVAANAQSRVYGDANPTLTYAVGGAGLVNGDALSGALSTAATTTSNVGSYVIAQGSLAASSNYTLSYTGNNLAVTPRAITVAADAQSRVYGDANPSLTYAVGGSGLVNGDALSGALATAATTSSNVGSYGITQGSLAAASNYTLSYSGNNVAVTARPITVSADAQSRVYGDANPALTYAVGGSGLVNGDTLSGALSTTATTASNVGSYGIAQGSLAASSNYTVGYSGNNLAVTARPIAVTADAQSRIYGDANPALSYAIGGSGLVNGDTLSGALSTAATTTSNVGSYAIAQGSLAASSNYTLSYTGNNLAVTPRAITVAADAQSRVYGDANPSLTYAVGGSGLVNGDVLWGTLATTATTSSNVGSYGIAQGSLAASSNYSLSYSGSNLSVTARPITVSADAQSRVYGDANPALSYAVGGSGLVNGDALSGALATAATTSSNVGSYGITQGSLAAASNYTLSYSGNNVAVTARPITVSADAQSRVYGDANPALTYAVGGSGLVNGDTLSGALSTTATTASNVGSYGIAQGSLAASSNYTVGYSGNNLAVTARPIAVTADAQSRIYGDANPALSYAIGGSGLVNGDTLSGALSTAATTTSNVGSYAIAQGSLAASSNYTLSYTGNNLAVTPRAITVAADAQSRVYGDANPSLTYAVGGSGLVNGDVLWGTLATTATTSSNVGSYGIAQGSLAASSNYSLSYSGSNLSVTARPITVSADAQSRVYGDANPALSYAVGGSGLVNGDALSGALATAATTSSNVGSYGITQGSLAAASNYTLSYSGNNVAVTARPITVSADAQSRVYGDANPALTYAVGGSGLVNGDTLSGALSTTATTASNVGSYGIAQGSLAASSNYTVGYSGNNLAVTARPIAVTADAQSRIYGDANPALSYAIGGSGLVNGDTLSGALSTAATTTSNVGSYAIAQGSLAASSNYTLSYTGNNLAVTPRAITVAADAQSRVYGDANPSLTYAVGGSGLVNGDVLWGTLATTATTSSNVGSYGIAQGSLAASSNYSLSYSGSNLSVTARPITVSADAQSRVYGDANPALSYAVGGSGLVNGDALSGALATAATTSSNVGSYGITQGSLAAASNYTLSYSGNNVAVTARPITVSADAQSRVYGDANPALTYAVGGSGLVNGDTLSGALSTTATTASNVGSYGIAQGSLAASSNYTVGYSGNNLAVTARPIAVTADAQSRIYGDANPALSYAIGGSGLVNGDTLSGALSTAATTTSNVGSYAIAQGSLAASSNYTLSYTGNNLAVTPRAITVAADAQSRVYGDANPSLTYAVGGSGLVNGDVLWGTLATTATTSSNVGSYGIAQGSLAASSNYSLSYSGSNLSVTARPITVSADAQSRVYGDANPALSYAVGGSGLVNGDALSGALATAATTSSNVGSYGITQGSLAAASNYTLSYSGNNVAVTARPITVSADAQSRVYGDANPALTYAVGGSGLVNGDTLSGALSTTATTASNVGSYGIAQGSLAASSNYTVGYSGNNLAVTARPIAVTADAQSRIYGDANPALSYAIGGSGLVNGDTLSGALSTAATTTSNVGSYAIAQGSLAASSNYTLSYTGNNLAVTPRAITVAADAQSRVYGDANPTPTFAVGGSGLVNGDTLTGSLATAATTSSNVGSYGITAGSLAASSNYSLSYTGASLAVTPRSLGITARDANKVTGTGLSFLGTEFIAAGLVNGDAVTSVSLASAGAAANAALGTYAITASGASGHGLSNYTLSYVPGSLTVRQVVSPAARELAPPAWSCGTKPLVADNSPFCFDAGLETLSARATAALP